MNGYNQICVEVGKDRGQRWKTDSELFNHVCSVEYGIGCVMKQGVLAAKDQTRLANELFPLQFPSITELVASAN